jgi:hypothetical protein
VKLFHKRIMEGDGSLPDVMVRRFGFEGDSLADQRLYEGQRQVRKWD